MSFISDCKAELFEGLKDNPVHAASEIAHGGPEAVRRYRDNPNSFTKRFASAAFQGWRINQAIKKHGYDPNKMMLSASLMASMHGPGPGGPMPIHEGMEF